MTREEFEQFSIKFQEVMLLKPKQRPSQVSLRSLFPAVARYSK